MEKFNLVTDALISQASYESNNRADTKIIDGWKPYQVVSPDGQPLDPANFSPTFGAQLYEKNGEYKVVFRGTEGNLADWAQNFKFGTFQWSAEFKDTVAFMAKAVVQVAKENRESLQEAVERFTTTGHSQGGFQAELAALMFGVKGTSLDGMGATGVVRQFRAALNQEMQDNGAGELVGEYSPEFKTRIFSMVGRLGIHTGETDGAWSWSLNKLVSVANPALGGIAVLGGLRAHKIADIIANEELRERQPLWRLIGDASDILNLNNPTQMAQSVAYHWSSVQVSDATGELPTLPDTSHIQSRLQEFLEEHHGQNYDQQTLGKNVLIRMQNGDSMMLYADGSTAIVTQLGEAITVREYAQDGSLHMMRQDQPDGQGNTLVNEQGEGFRAAMTVSASGQVLTAQSMTYQGTTLQTSTEITTETINGQNVQVKETINHLAQGSEVASIKELLTADQTKIINTQTADGHLEESTYTLNPETGEAAVQSHRVLSYSEAERSLAASDVALAGLELLQALRANNKLQAAANAPLFKQEPALPLAA